MRPRGPLTAQHLATRERPGEVTLVLWFLGVLALLCALNLAFCLLTPFPTPSLASEAAWVALGNALALAWMGACIFGLLRGTPWGWWLTTSTLAFFALMFGLLLLTTLLDGRDDLSFAGSIPGMALMAVFICLFSAPFFLLVKARRRYLEWRTHR